MINDLFRCNPVILDCYTIVSLMLFWVVEWLLMVYIISVYWGNRKTIICFLMQRRGSRPGWLFKQKHVGLGPTAIIFWRLANFRLALQSYITIIYDLASNLFEVGLWFKTFIITFWRNKPGWFNRPLISFCSFYLTTK